MGTIGNSVIDRSSLNYPQHTVIDLNNPATETGNITSISMYCYDASGSRTLYVGVFTFNGGTSYTCTNYVNLGTFYYGLNTWTDLTLPVLQNQYLGFYIEGSSSFIEADYNSNKNSVSVSGNNIFNTGYANDYTVDTGCINSIAGSIQGLGIKWNNTTVSKWNNTIVTNRNEN